MRKITLSIVTCMVFVFANAQSTRFGVKGGLNISNFTGYQEDVKSLAGFHIGGFAEIKVRKNLEFSPSFCFLHKVPLSKGMMEIRITMSN